MNSHFLKARLLEICNSQIIIAKRRKLKSVHILNKILKQIEEKEIHEWKQFVELKYVGPKTIDTFKAALFKNNSDKSDKRPSKNENSGLDEEKKLNNSIVNDDQIHCKSTEYTISNNNHTVKELIIPEGIKKDGISLFPTVTSDYNQNALETTANRSNDPKNLNLSGIETYTDRIKKEKQPRRLNGRTKVTDQKVKTKKRTKTNGDEQKTFNILEDFDYIPGYNTTAYHILKSLNITDGQSQSHLNLSIQLNQPQNNTTTNLYISAAIKTLMRRYLVEKDNKKYFLSRKGLKLAEILFPNDNDLSKKNHQENILPRSQLNSIPEVVKDPFDWSKQAMNGSKIPFSLENTYSRPDQDIKDKIKTNYLSSLQESINVPISDLILLVDAREMKSKNDRTFFERNFPQSRTLNLSVGDFIWIKNQNLLNIIIERKKATDFISSLTDGRFNEQKNRLKNTGIDNIIYLIEGLKNKEPFAESAILKTKLEGFTVIETADINQTVAYITHLDDCFRSSYNSKIKNGKIFPHNQNLALYHFSQITNISFSDFSNNSLKSKNLSENRLLYLTFYSIRGITHEKAEFLTEKFKTFEIVFEQAISGDMKKTLKELEFYHKKLGISLIEKILDYFSVVESF